MSFAARTLGGLGGASSPTVTYIGNTNNTFTASPMTFAAQSYGGPGTIIVAVMYEGSNATTPTSTGVTLGGVSMTLVDRITTNFSNDGEASLWRLDVGSGSSADVVISYTGTIARGGVAVWRIEGNSSSTPTATSVGGTSGSGTFNVPLTASAVGDVLVVCCCTGNSPTDAPAVTVSYSSPTVSDFLVTSGSGSTSTGLGGGHATLTSASYTESVVIANNSQSTCIVAATWR